MNLGCMVCGKVTRPKQAQNIWRARPEHLKRAQEFVDHIGLNLDILESRPDIRKPTSSSISIVLNNDTMAAAKFLVETQYQLPLHMLARALLLGWLKDQLPSVGMPLPSELHEGSNGDGAENNVEDSSPSAANLPLPARRKKVSRNADHESLSSDKHTRAPKSRSNRK